MSSAAVRRGPAVFLDKDGTLLQDLPWNVDPQRMQLAPTAAASLAALGRLGVPLLVVSNQSGVELGKFGTPALATVGRALAALFAGCGARLSGFLWCPHAPDREGQPRCSCRKPNPGLLRTAAQRFAIDPHRSWMVGDILDDVEAGRRAGCRTILVDTGNETVWKAGPWRQPHHRVGDLASAAALIVADGRLSAPAVGGSAPAAQTPHRAGTRRLIAAPAWPWVTLPVGPQERMAIPRRRFSRAPAPRRASSRSGRS